MFGFLRSFFLGGDAAAMKLDVASAVDDGLNLGAAISAHENWKIRLDSYLSGKSTEDLRSEVICFDDRCDLGKWIHSTGKERLGKYPGFTALLADHKQFHYAASNVVALAKAGKLVEADQMLKGPYARASLGVINALTEMRKTLKR
jgi:hypothetical protein